MPLTIGNAPPSTLSAVIGAVSDLFASIGDSTVIMIGDAFEEFGAGSPPRVLFVPETEGSLGDPLKVGNEASYTHGCEVFIRARAGLDDIGRFDPAYALLNRVVSALKRSGGGNLKCAGKVSNTSPTKTDDGSGVELSFSFTYARDMEKDAAIYAAKPRLPDVVPVYPNPPPGIPATDVITNPTANPPAS